MKLKEKLWNWAHLEGSHNKYTSMTLSMTPETFAEEFGIPNAFVVSFGGNIQPPFDDMAKRMSGLRELKWAVLSDISTPLPEDELGNTKDVLAVAEKYDHITGGIMDDFFFPERMERFTPEVLKKIRKALNDKGMDFWCVLYTNQLEEDLGELIDCYDGVSMWVWESENIVNMDQYFAKLKELAPDKKLMLGLYLWDYNTKKEMDPALFEKHLSFNFSKIESGEIEGMIVCSNAVGDAGFKSCDILKEYVAKYGDKEV